MTSEADANSEDLREAVQAAVDAAATAYTEDAGTDVQRRLREELSRRGVDVDDDAWLAEAARNVRSGHHVTVGAPPERGGATDRESAPGSLGGDNGGG